MSNDQCEETKIEALRDITKKAAIAIGIGLWVGWISGIFGVKVIEMLIALLIIGFIYWNSFDIKTSTAMKINLAALLFVALIPVLARVYYGRVFSTKSTASSTSGVGKSGTSTSSTATTRPTSATQQSYYGYTKAPKIKYKVSYR